MPRSIATLVWKTLSECEARCVWENRRTAVQIAKAMMTRRMDLLRPEPARPPRTSRTTPDVKAVMASAVTRTASMATTTMATGSIDERGTQAGLNWGREKPTKTAPRTKRPAMPAWSIICSVFDLAPTSMAQSRYCSTAKRASWSKMVLKTMPIWHEDAAVGEMAMEMKSLCAHRAAEQRKRARASLWPSRKTALPWLPTCRMSAAAAALTTMPLDC